MSLQQYAPLVVSEASKYGLDVPTMLALVENESGWNANAQSPTKVKGLMQTTKVVQDEYNKQFNTKLDRNNPADSIKIGTWYFAKNASRFPDDPDAQIAAYSATGPNGVAALKNQYGDQWQSKLPAGEKADYVPKIKALIPKYASNKVEGIQLAQNDTGTMTDADPYAKYVAQPESDPYAKYVNQNTEATIQAAPLEQSTTEQSPQDSFGSKVVKSTVDLFPESAQGVASGIIEPIATVASGIPATAAAGYGAIASTLTGGDVGQTVNDIQKRFTYEPRTTTGMIKTSQIGKGIDAIGKTITDIPAGYAGLGSAILNRDLGAGANTVRQIEDQGLHQTLGNTAESLGAPPSVSALAYTAPDIAATFMGGLAGKARPVTNNVERINKLAGRVNQGAKKDIAPTIKATELITPEEVQSINTYDDLSNVMNKKLAETGAKQDAILSSNTETYRLPKLNVKSGDTQINWVNQMLNGMKEFYAKTKDYDNLGKVSALKEKALTDGLTVKEINDLARMHSHDMSSYNANSELASGISKVANENIRKGVKNTVKNLVDDPQYKALDKDFEIIFNTKKLAQKNYDNFLKSQNRIKDEGFLRKYGVKTAEVINQISRGYISGFVSGFVPKGAGMRLNTSHGMGIDLSKNLQELHSLVNKDLPPKVLKARLDKLMYNSDEALSALLTTKISDKEDK